MYNDEEKAIHFVFKAFEGKKRLKENIDLVFHSISVGYLLKANNCRSEIIVVGFLHDVLEDTNTTYKEIYDNFGEKIASMVMQITENKDISSWKKRKQEFINRLEKASNEILLVECADKLNNLLSDYDLYKEIGSSALETDLASYKDNKWYYTTIYEIISKKMKNDMTQRYYGMLNLYFPAK